MSDLLIVGQGRSGTTWVGEVLGRAEGARYVHEPDDERRDPKPSGRAQHFGPSVLIVTRHPLDVLASRLDLEWGVSQDGPLPPPGSEATSELQQMAWQIGSFGVALAAAASRHPGWEVVRHEDLC